MQIKIVSMAHNPNEIDVRAMFSASWKFSASLFLRPIDPALRAYKKKKRDLVLHPFYAQKRRWMDRWMDEQAEGMGELSGWVNFWVSN